MGLAADAQPQGQHGYKPWIMKTPALCFLLGLAVLLIGLTEFAVRKLPTEETHLMTSNWPALGRQIAPEFSISVSTFTTVVESVTETHEVTYSFSSSTYTCPLDKTCSTGAPKGVWLPIGTVTIGKGKGNVPNTSPIPTPVGGSPTPVAQPNPVTAPATPIGPATPANGPPTPVVPASQVPTTLPNGSVATTTVSNSQIGSNTTPPPANASQDPTPKGPKGSGDPDAANSGSNSSETVVVFMASEYFIGAFFPTLIAILFAIPWSVLDNRVKRMEPFFQLAKPSGAAALYSVCLEYSTLSPFLGLIRAILPGHWSTVLSSILTLLAALLAPVAAEAVNIRLFGECSATEGGCAGGLAVAPTVARAAQGLLALMVLLTMLLMTSLWRRSTGVFSEPFSIAGVATLFHHPVAVNEFAAIAAQGKMSSREIRKNMAHLRFTLGTYVDKYGYSRYGLVPLQNDHESHEGKHGTGHYSQYGQYGVGGQQGHMEPVKFSYPLRIPSGALAAMLAALLALIAYYYQNSADTPFERFMNSQAFGVRFLFALIGVIVNAMWKKIFERISLLAPYRSMNKSATLAARSVLLVPSTLPVTGFFKSMRAGHHAVALVALSTLLADILTITLANVPFSNATVYEAFVACVWISMAILVVMILTLVFVFFMSQPDLPRKPNSLASTLSYLSSSDMGLRLAEYATIPPKERDRALKELELRYRFGNVNSHSGWSQAGIRVE